MTIDGFEELEQSASLTATLNDELLREAEALSALADLFPHLRMNALRSIQDLFPMRAQGR
jgi:hypothetical protein